MKLFKCPVSGAELFTDASPMKHSSDGFCHVVRGKHITRREGDVQLAGSNPSQEEQQEDQDDASVQSGIDIALNNHLTSVEDIFTKKSFKKYMMGYMKHITESKKGCKEFKEAMSGKKEAFLAFCDMFSEDVSVFASEDNFDPGEPKSVLMIGVWDNDEIDIYIPCCFVDEEKL